MAGVAAASAALKTALSGLPQTEQARPLIRPGSNTKAKLSPAPPSFPPPVRSSSNLKPTPPSSAPPAKAGGQAPVAKQSPAPWRSINLKPTPPSCAPPTKAGGQTPVANQSPAPWISHAAPAPWKSPAPPSVAPAATPGFQAPMAKRSAASSSNQANSSSQVPVPWKASAPAGSSNQSPAPWEATSARADFSNQSQAPWQASPSASSSNHSSAPWEASSLFSVAPTVRLGNHQEEAHQSPAAWKGPAAPSVKQGYNTDAAGKSAGKKRPAADPDGQCEQNKRQVRPRNEAWSSSNQQGGSWNSSPAPSAPRTSLAQMQPQRSPCSSGTPFSALFVAEKPAIARMIAEAFGTAANGKGSGKQKSYTEESSASGASVPTFIVDVPWTCRSPAALAQASSVQLRITSTVGHVYACEFPQHLRRWKGVDPLSLFDAAVERIEPNDGKSKIPEHLAEQASHCHLVVLWLDCDREGENICYEVLENVIPALTPHPRLKVPEGHWNPREDDYKSDPRIWRVRFSSLAAADLLGAFTNLRKPNPYHSLCVDARAEIDLKVGISLTRLITSNLRDLVSDLAPSREDGKGAMISYGPCQTPTLWFCVNRWDAIQRHTKEMSFTIDAEIWTNRGEEQITLHWEPPEEMLAAADKGRGGKGSGKGKDGKDAMDDQADSGKGQGGKHWGKGKDGKDSADDQGGESNKWKRKTTGLPQQQVARLVAQMMPNTPALLTSRSCEQQWVDKPTALNTVAMLKAASRELAMDPHTCMHIAEKLYTSGITTYPRTETSQYPPSMDLAAMVSEHSWHPKWGKWCERLQGGLMQEPVAGHDAGDHPPITPVYCASEDQVRRKAGADGVKLYEMICRYFLASVSPAVLYNHYEIRFGIGSLEFSLSGNEITDQGFTRICRGAAKQVWELKEENLIGDALVFAKSARVGSRYELTKNVTVRLEDSRPPELLTEADLLDLMEKRGIGTDASMAQHVHNVVTRGYVEVLEPGRRMRPTILGAALVHGLRMVDNELVKPAVRARIEKEVSDVANRRKTFSQVVASSLDTFREKYHNVLNGMPKLIEEFEWKRKKWKQWRDYDAEYAKRGGGVEAAHAKGESSEKGKGSGKSMKCSTPLPVASSADVSNHVPAGASAKAPAQAPALATWKSSGPTPAGKGLVPGHAIGKGKGRSAPY